MNAEANRLVGEALLQRHKTFTAEDLIGFMESQLFAAREHRRLTFIYRSSPRRYQKIILSQLIAADDAKQKFNSKIQTSKTDIIQYNEACATCGIPRDLHLGPDDAIRDTPHSIWGDVNRCRNFVRYDPPRAAYGELAHKPESKKCPDCFDFVRWNYGYPNPITSPIAAPEAMYGIAPHLCSPCPSGSTPKLKVLGGNKVHQ